MRNLYVIALHTLREELRRKTFYLFFLFPPICTFASTVFTPLMPGSEKAFVVDIALSTISFFVMLMSAFMTCDIFSKEVQLGTFYLFLTNPVRSLTHVLGKYLGCLIFLGYGIFLMAVFMLGLVALKFQQFDLNILKAILLLMGELIVLMGLGILSSTFLSKFTNFLFVIVLYLVGHLGDYMHYFNEHFSEVPGAIMVQILFKLIPDLNQFEVRDWVVMGLNIEGFRIIEAFGYAIFSASISILLSAWILQKRVVG